MFKPVSPQVDINALEKQVMELWREKDVFQRTMKEREGGPTYVFYEGPPTANGLPGSHHVLSRSFKDIFPRYKTMNGYFVRRKGGWDTHGLPVEIAVEKELGINHKSEIEEYGIAAFNEKCRESVFRNIQEWNALTERIAFWVDLDDAYVTFTRDYIESVWWILKQLWDKGLIYQGYKVVPYCPRCGTPLSSHEVSLGYEEVDDPSVYVRFKALDEENAYFLAWTTTPWTLPGNVALTVGEKIDYVKVKGRVGPDAPEEYLYVARDRLQDAVLSVVKEGGGYEVVEELKGKDLAGRHYDPLFKPYDVEQDYAYITLGTYVSTEDGTGIVHTAPAFGADDMETQRKYDLPVLVTVDADGHFKDGVNPVGGMWFKDADNVIVRDLRDRGLLFNRKNYRHNYPHCWRDKGPLMYYARDTWYIRTTDYRDELVDLNNTINWVPDHIRTGRFGNWLAEVKDWALGRERYWGTPLPVWVADDPDVDYMVCVGSIKELEMKTGQDLSDLDPHRPYVDDITWQEEINGKTVRMRRVPEIIDVWFDSGAMPVAQWGYPQHNQDLFEEQFPADYISEAVDQTRGWFYSLHAIATMVFDSVAYKNVICLGHIMADDGSKMSKSKGNIVEPWEVIERYGADNMRWYMFTASQPGESSRMGWRDPAVHDEIPGIAEVVRNFYLKLWNTYSFFVTYANIDKFDPKAYLSQRKRDAIKVIRSDEQGPIDQPSNLIDDISKMWSDANIDKFNPKAETVPLAERDQLDQWILSALHALVRDVTQAFEKYDVIGATRPIEAFVDDLSNWYLRRSRRRFWQDDNSKDKQAAYQTLYECLVTVAKLLAPSMPFVAESLYQNLVVETGVSDVDSVHLAEWPKVDEAVIDEELNYKMALVQRMVSLALAARNEAGIRVRQPLSEVYFGV
ncbi:MAG: isoleucine--tRNA ligase, partial [Chloroflexi bacterium]|nr:isoleucine--tRNA ligase [Chloroflexota bacterium]